ncbi:hypothetical protein FCM35_KLT02624 [Carex littledalei]|uniref:DUF1664 domain-containing protein n=1 Tax=Carex littledalei TaxID=544730 RepID=A0A833R448_9POAL|nr:hypothetical protein FCM35_KLT02624 [Carex littledalei]
MEVTSLTVSSVLISFAGHFVPFGVPVGCRRHFACVLWLVQCLVKSQELRFKFSDLMYVTKRNMASAVSGMTKHLEQVSAAFASVKMHLTQCIERLDDKLDE